MNRLFYIGAALVALALPLLGACGSSDDSTPTPIPYHTPAAGATTAVATSPAVTTGTTTSGQSAVTPSPATSPATGGGGVTIATTEKDFSITPAQTTVAAGKVTFDVKNDGPSQHEFVVFKTDLAEDKLPVKNGNVDESGAGLTHIDEAEDIDAGQSKTLTIENLPAGNYVLICNKPAHYVAGMHVAVKVQ
jgi:uncharacterized cupredoxin-like copper-binding protein